MKTNELTGAALDWAVAKCEGRQEPEVVNNFAVAWYTWPHTIDRSHALLCSIKVWR